MTNSGNKIIILGGGISGITTGIVLQVLGFRTEILTGDRADRPSDPDDPAFASLYPSASVIPHSVHGSDIPQLFEESQLVFELLLAEQAPGVTLNRHYEVFEYPIDPPPYTRKLKNFRRIDNRWKLDPDLPRMESTETLTGWVFDCFFADWPVYLTRLFEWYERLGGNITLVEITGKRLDTLEETLINCLGLGSLGLFDDPAPHTVSKGHLVQVGDAPEINNKMGQTVSYNYNPAPEKYSDSEGNAQDLYCYSRSDGCILGGSRLEGTIGPDGNWTGIAPGEALIEIDGVQVPAPILKINAGILSETYGLSLNDFNKRSATVGYRYLRDKNGGLRLEQVQTAGKRIIHNYGHGGAGVTLSWGCALRIARWLAAGNEGFPDIDLNRYGSLSKALYKQLLRLISHT